MTEQCDNCRFWKESDYMKEHGHCHLHPPMMVAFDYFQEGPEDWSFPITSNEQWCGDYQENVFKAEGLN